MKEHQLPLDTIQIIHGLVNTGDDMASILEQMDGADHDSLVEKWDSKVEKILKQFEDAGLPIPVSPAINQ